MIMKMPYSVIDIAYFNNNSRLNVDGQWVPARPIRYRSIWNDFKLAWLVFTGKADAFIWPEDDIKE